MKRSEIEMTANEDVLVKDEKYVSKEKKVFTAQHKINLLCTRLLKTVTPSTSGVEGTQQNLRYDDVRCRVLWVSWEPEPLTTVKFSHRKLALHLNK